MGQEPSDWRLMGQEKYLMGESLRFKSYPERKTATDHDHCEFCFQKFMDSGEDTIQQGFATLDDYRWICPTCYEDFNEQFQFKIQNSED